MSKRVCLGKISSAHGVKGFVKILPYGEDPTLIETLGPAYISEDSDKTVIVRFKSGSGKYILAEIDGCDDRDKAQALRGTLLYYNRDLLPDLEKDDGFYHADLVGLTVVEDGLEVGRVLAVSNFGAGDLLEIQPKSGEEFYLPYNDDYLVSVDLKAQTITVRNHKDMIIG